MTHTHHGADRVQEATLPPPTAAMNMTPMIDVLKLSINTGSVELPNLEQRLREIYQDRHDKTLYVAAAGGA